jgi:DNA polymerase-3 subunit alpha
LAAAICGSAHRTIRARGASLLICQNHEGYLNLSRLVSRAWRDGQQGGRALVDAAWLNVETTKGLIALIGRESEIGRVAVHQGTDHARSRVYMLAALFPDRLYLELTRCGREGEETWNNAALALGTEANLPVIASNDVRFLKQPDLRRTKRACVSIKGACWPIQNARAITANSSI